MYKTEWETPESGPDWFEIRMDDHRHILRIEHDPDTGIGTITNLSGQVVYDSVTPCDREELCKQLVYLMMDTFENTRTRLGCTLPNILGYDSDRYMAEHRPFVMAHNEHCQVRI